MPALFFHGICLLLIYLLAVDACNPKRGMFDRVVSLIASLFWCWSGVFGA